MFDKGQSKTHIPPETCLPWVTNGIFCSNVFIEASQYIMLFQPSTNSYLNLSCFI